MYKSFIVINYVINYLFNPGALLLDGIRHSDIEIVYDPLQNVIWNTPDFSFNVFLSLSLCLDCPHTLSPFGSPRGNSPGA